MVISGLEVKHDNLVDSLSQPRGGHEQALLRTDLPIPAKVVPIQPDISLSPPLHVQESVAQRRQFKLATPESWSLNGRLRKVQGGKVRHRQSIILPSTQLRPGKRNASNDSLPVVHKTWTEIDTAHVLHENIQRLATFEVDLQ